MKHDEDAMELIIDLVEDAYSNDEIDNKEYVMIMNFLDWVNWAGE